MIIRFQCTVCIIFFWKFQLMHRLNQVHITMSDASKRNNVKEFGSGLEIDQRSFKWTLWKIEW